MNKKLAFELLQILCINDSSHPNFAREYIAIEERLIQAGIDNTVLLDYIPPYNKDCRITMSVVGGKLNLSVENEGSVISIDHHGSLRELYVQGESLRKFMDKLHLTFAPVPDNNFTKEIMTANKGTIINFNNQLAIVCVDDKDGKKIFKRQFEGSLSNITLDSFRKSDTYVVDVNNPKDLHYLFGKAYTSLTNTADVRITQNSGMGQYICTDIEAALPTNSSRSVLVGPLRLYLSKDASGHCAWYDESLNVIERDMVGVILGWAKTTLSEINTQQWLTNSPMSGFSFFSETDYSPFLAKIKRFSAENDVNAIAAEAFNFAESRGGIMSLTFTGLVQDADNNFISTTYAFASNNGEKKIYKFTHKENNMQNLIETKQEISTDEFLTFCKEKFNKSYRSIISQSTELIRNLYQNAGISKEDAIRTAIKKYEEEHSENFLGITKEDINRISQNVAILIAELSRNKNAFSIKVHDFLEEDYPDTR